MGLYIWNMVNSFCGVWGGRGEREWGVFMKIAAREKYSGYFLSYCFSNPPTN